MKSQDLVRSLTHYFALLYRIRTRTFALSLALFAAIGLGGESSAFFYPWNNPSGGDYGSAFNWNPTGGAPPDAIDGAGFGLNATYNIDFFTWTQPTTLPGASTVARRNIQHVPISVQQVAALSRLQRYHNRRPLCCSYWREL